MADGKWHDLVGTYDGGQVRLYVDGKQAGGCAKAASIFYQPDQVAIGRDGGAADSPPGASLPPATPPATGALPGAGADLPTPGITDTRVNSYAKRRATRDQLRGLINVTAFNDN